ncbi:MAG: indoleacetamide hydrolase, partial [Steroidobacteraceae bacterium]
DVRQRTGHPIGPLHGVPLALKDNLDTLDHPTTAGTPALRGHRPRTNGIVVQRLIDAGAIVLGKANLHELAFGVTSNNAEFGPARNPYDPTRIPGGSSGGTGIAVAARLAPAGIGTDTGGSIRVPAALCGIVGFRPTTGRWPQGGIVPISHTRDTAGPMTCTVVDAALLDSVVTDDRSTLARTALSGLRLGVPRRHFHEDLDPDVAGAMAAVLARLEESGVILIERDVPDVTELDRAAGFPIALYEAVRDIDRYLNEHSSPLDLSRIASEIASPDVRELLSGALGSHRITDDAYRAALLDYRPALQRAYRRFFAEHNLAAAIFPTTPLAAAPIGEDTTCELDGRRVPTFVTFTRNTAPGSLAGIPGISLPAGLSAAGLPIGVSLDGPAGQDRRLLALAAAIEPVLPALPRPRPSAGRIASVPAGPI